MQFMGLEVNSILKTDRIAFFSSLKLTHSFNLPKALLFHCSQQLRLLLLPAYFSHQFLVLSIPQCVSNFYFQRLNDINPTKRSAPKPSTLLDEKRALKTDYQSSA